MYNSRYQSYNFMQQNVIQSDFIIARCRKLKHFTFNNYFNSNSLWLTYATNVKKDLYYSHSWDRLLKLILFYDSSVDFCRLPLVVRILFQFNNNETHWLSNWINGCANILCNRNSSLNSTEPSNNNKMMTMICLCKYTWKEEKKTYQNGRWRRQVKLLIATAE